MISLKEVKGGNSIVRAFSTSFVHPEQTSGSATYTITHNLNRNIKHVTARASTTAVGVMNLSDLDYNSGGSYSPYGYQIRNIDDNSFKIIIGRVAGSDSNYTVYLDVYF